jgi:hypothetical protein
MNKKIKPIPFDSKLSLRLDRATQQAEQGKRIGKLKKRYIEWPYSGANHD